MRRVVWIALVSLSLCSPAAFATDWFDYMGKRYDVDPYLLRAIAEQESMGHPWTVNLNGEPFFLKNKEQAVDLVKTAQSRPWLAVIPTNDRPVRYLFPTKLAAEDWVAARYPYADARIRKVDPENVDIGLMQINWKWHGDRVPSLERLFDVDYNIAYAAFHLKELMAKYPVDEAIGRYHSPTPSRAANYRKKVYRHYAVVSGSAP